MEVLHEIWLQLAQWFQRRYLKTHTHTHTHTYTHTHTFLHTRTQQLRVVPDELIWRGGAGGLWRQSTIFLWGWELGVVGLFFFQSSWQLAFVKMYNFLQVMVPLKNAICSNWDLLEWKIVPTFRRGLFRKKWVIRVPIRNSSANSVNQTLHTSEVWFTELAEEFRMASAMVMVLSPGEYTVLHPGKTG